MFSLALENPKNENKMSEETTDAVADTGKKKKPGKVLGMLGMIFGIIGLIFGIVAYMAIPSDSSEVTSMNDVGSAVGGGISLLVGGFFAYAGLICGVIGVIMAFVKKAESKVGVIIGLVIPIVAIVILKMATPSMEAADWDTSDWRNTIENAADEVSDELNH